MKEHPTPSWYQQLKQTPWELPQLSQDRIERVIELVNTKRDARKWIAPLFSLLTIGAAVAAFMVMFGLDNLAPGKTTDPLPTPLLHQTNPEPMSTTHGASWRAGVKVFEAFPGGEAASGRANGCWWNIYIPFEELKGSRLRVDAVHKMSGMKFSEIPEIELTSPTLSYNDFTRISSRFDLPFGGVWEYTMYLNDNKLGEVAFDIPEGNWQPSPTFQFESSVLTGVKGRVGFLDVGLGAGLPKNKFMWYFWGRDDAETRKLFGKKLSIIGTLKGSQTSVTLFEGSIGTPNPLIPNNDKVGKAPVSMSLPTAGAWRLDSIIDDQWFGSVFVEVK